jgi:hypothetical protein
MSNKRIFRVILIAFLCGALISLIVTIARVPTGGLLFWSIWIGGGVIIGLLGGLIMRYQRSRKNLSR